VVPLGQLDAFLKALDEARRAMAAAEPRDLLDAAARQIDAGHVDFCGSLSRQ
jgi:hypothetical protein